MQAEWELSKENFQPLKRGRKEVVCEQESKACHKADIEGQRRCVRMRLSTAAMTFPQFPLVYRDFWQELQTDSGEDPLDVWIRSVFLCVLVLLYREMFAHNSCVGSSSGHRIPLEAVAIKLSCCRFWSAARASCSI